MKSKLRTINYLLLFSLLLSPLFSKAQTDIHGTWWTPKKGGQIKMYLAKDGKTYGKMAWLKEPNEENGTPKVDNKNPNPDLRKEPLLGLLIFKHFTYDGNNKWVDGEVYDAQTGKTYSCQMTLIEPNKLEVRGYIGIPMFGRAEIFTRVVE